MEPELTQPNATTTVEEELRRRTRTLELLNRVSNTLVAELELEKIVQAVTDAGREISGAAFGAFFYNVKSEQGEAYTLYTLSGAPREAFAKFPMPRNTALFGPTFRGEGLLRIGDVLQDPRYGHSAPYHGMPAGHLPVRSYLAAPVVSRSGEVLGGLFYGHPSPNVFTAESEDSLRGLAAQAAIAIDNANLYSALQRNVAEQTRGRDAAQRLAAIVESSDDAIISKNLDGIIQSWNQGAERIFGYAPEEVIGKSILIIIPPERQQEETLILGRVRSGQRVDHFDTVRRRKDGTLLDISLTVSPVRSADGKIIGASKIARDVTERKLADKKLHELKDHLARMNAELENRVEERTASLREAMSQLEEFSYSVSHDLRAPVRAMQAYARALQEDYGDRLDEDGRGFLRRIIEGGARMDRLIRDVLTYSRLTQADIQLTSVDLGELVEEIVRDYPELQPSHAEIVTNRPLLRAMAHEPSLGQAVANLLRNAVKFVAPGVFPKVLIRTEAIGNQVRLWVEDNGIGIKPEHQKRVFGMFERLHPDKQYEGTGIGLAIVRKVAERMRGRVGLESDGVTGSKFWIELPAAN